MQLDIKQIKTLYSIWNVIYQKKIMLDNKEVLGMICYSKKLIKISTRQSIENQIQTLEHEKLHATFSELKINIIEERELDVLACAEIKFIQENPELIKIILEGCE
jgi:hypothetical protein